MLRRESKTINFFRGKLPHWEVENGLYFITIHLKGALPKGIKERIYSKYSEIESTDYLDHQRAIFKEMEYWLDNMTINQYLNEPQVAAMIEESIQYRHDKGEWDMKSYVIMPNHIHIFCSLNGKRFQILNN